MSAVLEARRPASPLPSTGRAVQRVVVGIGVLAIMALAFVIRYKLLTRGVGVIAPGGYDDGVYYAAADALVNGRLPYRDFLLLHPPAILLALAPFAAFGRAFGDPSGVAAARIAFIGIGALNAGMITLLAGRYGRIAGALAGLTAAVFYPLAYAERSTLLEPLGTAFLLGSLLMAQRGEPRDDRPSGRRWVLLAGVLAGFSVDVKIWYVVPVLVLIAFQRPHRLRFLIGAVLGAAAVAVPFFAVAPVAMVREIVFDQFGRPQSIFYTLTERLIYLAGVPKVHAVGATALRDQERIALVVIVVAVIAAAATMWVRGARRYPVLIAATVAVLLAGPSFYLHYVAFVAPWLAITLGIGIGALLRLLPWWPPRVLIAAVLVVAFVAVNLPADRSTTGKPFPGAALRPAAQAVDGCVISDDPAVLAALNVLSRDYERGCTVWPDVTGWNYDADGERVNGELANRVLSPVWQRAVLRYLTSGQAVILSRESTGLNPTSLSVIARMPKLARRPHWVLHQVTQHH